MNTYSRALRHINMKDVKQKHQKKLVEKKLEELKKIEEKKYIQSVMEEKKCDWRKELNEAMTTSGMITLSLPPTGTEVIATQNGTTLSGNSEPGYYGLGSGLYAIPQNVDTMVFTVTPGVGQLELIAFVPNGNSISTYGPFGSGTHTVTLRPGDINKGLSYIWSVTNGLATSGFGTWIISGSSSSFIEFQRRAPMNVFVPLNSPEATAFVRVGSTGSPEERRKQLLDQLKSGKEYTQKQFGSDFPGSNYVMPGEAGDTPGVEVTSFDTSKMEKDYGQVAGGLTGAEIGALADIVLKSPDTQTRTNALDQLKQHIKPGSNNANKLQSMGINLGV